MKEVSLGSVKAANAANVTVENYGTVPPADAHESSCPRANSLPRPQHTYNIINSPKLWLGHRNIQYTVRYTELAPDRFRDFWSRMSVLIHEQGGRRTIYYPDDRHLRQYADSGPTLISIEIWPNAASAANAFRSGLVTWENDPHPPDAPVVY